MLPPFCISVSDPYKPCMEKLAAEGVIAYDTNAQVAEVSKCVHAGVWGVLWGEDCVGVAAWCVW